MQTQNPARHRLILAGAFTLFCVVLMTLTFRAIGGATPLQAQGYQFSLAVPDAGNLVTGSDVQEAGVKIGRVVSVRRAGAQGKVTIELEPKYSPISSAATAIVRSKTLLGEGYLELAPGRPDAPALQDHGDLPASQVKRNVSVNEFLDGFGPRSRAQMRHLFSGLARAFGRRSAELSATLGYAAPTSANLNEILTTLSSQTNDLQHLVSDSATVLETLGNRKHDLRAAVTAGNAVLDATASRDRALEATLRELPPFLHALRRTSTTITASAQPLDRAAATVLSVSPRLPTALDAIERNVPKFNELFRDLPATVSAAKKGLPALTRVVTAIPSGFDDLYPTLRQLIPIVQLFADYKQAAIIGPFANAGSAFAGTFVGPQGKILHRTNGALYLSNETVVGWTKRLPSNRANPYPKPDGFDELGKIGFLKSYDCRHLNNPIGLPPLGTGVPPCVEQGPWNYRGKTAYYPRLQPAAP